MIYQLIYARCNPCFKLKKQEDRVIFYTENKNYEDQGWYNVSNELLKDCSDLLSDSAQYIIDLCLISKNASVELQSKLESSYSYLHLKNNMSAIIYQFTKKDEGRIFRNCRHILFIKDSLPSSIKPAYFLSRDLFCWKATQSNGVKFHDGNQDRERLPVITNDDILKSVGQDSIASYKSEVFPFIKSNAELFKKSLCFILEHFSQEKIEKTLLIKDTQENMIMWVKALSYFIPPGLIQKFTFSTNLAKLNDGYFAVAGIHPESRAAISDKTDKYAIVDINNGKFDYDSPYLGSSFFEDIFNNGDKIIDFYNSFPQACGTKVIEFYEINSSKDNISSQGYEKVKRFFTILNKNREIYKIFDTDVYEQAHKIYSDNSLFNEDLKNSLSLFAELQKYNADFDLCELVKNFVCAEKDGKHIDYETAKKLFCGDASILPFLDKNKLDDLFFNFAVRVLAKEASYLAKDLKEKFVLFNVLFQNLKDTNRNLIESNIKKELIKFIDECNDKGELTALISNIPLLNIKPEHKDSLYEAFVENISKDNDKKFAWINEALNKTEIYDIFAEIGKKTTFSFNKTVIEYQEHLIRIGAEDKIKNFFATEHLPNSMDLRKNFIKKVPEIDPKGLSADYLEAFFGEYRASMGIPDPNCFIDEEAYINYIYHLLPKQTREEFCKRITNSYPDKEDFINNLYYNQHIIELIEDNKYKDIYSKVENNTKQLKFFYETVSKSDKFYLKAGEYREKFFDLWIKNSSEITKADAIIPLLRAIERKDGLLVFFQKLNAVKAKTSHLPEAVYAKYKEFDVIFDNPEVYQEYIKFFDKKVEPFCEYICEKLSEEGNEKELIKKFRACYIAVNKADFFDKSFNEKYVYSLDVPDKLHWGIKAVISFKRWLNEHRDIKEQIDETNNLLNKEEERKMSKAKEYDVAAKKAGLLKKIKESK